MRTTYYKPCPNCGANLDPGEQCGCQRPKETRTSLKQRQPKMRKSVRADAFERRESGI